MRRLFVRRRTEAPMVKHRTAREKRKARIRKKLSGTQERPRLTVYKSLNHMYAQLVDDVSGKTLAAASTGSKALKGEVKEDDKTGAAKKVGAAIGKAALEKGIKRVVFDRNGFDYHGRIAAVAQAAREAGLEF
jgi:large subunit ribosomal protein L18